MPVDWHPGLPQPLCIRCPPAPKLMIMERNSTPDYDLSDVADVSISRYQAAPKKMVTIRIELPIRHPPLAGLIVPHQLRVQELDSSDSAPAKNPLDIWISQSFTFRGPPHPSSKKQKETGLEFQFCVSLDLFPWATISLSRSGNVARYLAAAASSLAPHFLSLPLKGDPFRCHGADGSAGAALNDAALSLPSGHWWQPDLLGFRQIQIKILIFRVVILRERIASKFRSRHWIALISTFSLPHSLQHFQALPTRGHGLCRYVPPVSSLLSMIQSQKCVASFFSTFLTLTNLSHAGDQNLR